MKEKKKGLLAEFREEMILADKVNPTKYAIVCADDRGEPRFAKTVWIQHRERIWVYWGDQREYYDLYDALYIYEYVTSNADRYSTFRDWRIISKNGKEYKKKGG